MGTIEYTSLSVIKKSDKAVIEIAIVDGHDEPVVVKRLKGVNPEIFHQLSRLHSVFIPKIYFCEIQGEELIVVEECLDGENLEDYLRSNRINDGKKMDIALQLCEAVKCLHAQTPPIIHRDIKPSNILINEKGALKLIDFDASRYYREDDTRGDTRLLGTIEFAPPEQFGYSQTDVRSDVYSMGMVFRELELNEQKFLAKSWEKIIGNCRNFDPKDRYQSVEELEREIKKLLWLKSVTGKMVLGWVVAVLLFLIVIGQGCLLWRTKENAAAVPTLEPTATLTPEPTATLTPEPTATLTPEPTATLAPEPTATLTPEPTATLTSEPTDSGETDTLQSLRQTTEELDAYLDSTNQFYFGYYKDMAEETEFYMAHEFLLQEDVTCISAVFKESVTGKNIEVPAEMIEMEYGLLRISDEFLAGLKETYYELVFTYRNGNLEMCTNRDVLRIYAEADGRGEERIICNVIPFYRECPQSISMVIDWRSVRRIKGLYISCMGSLGMDFFEVNEAILTEVPADGYEISEDQKVLKLNQAFLEQYTDMDELTLYVRCDDDSYHSVVVTYKDGKPWWIKE